MVLSVKRFKEVITELREAWLSYKWRTQFSRPSVMNIQGQKPKVVFEQYVIPHYRVSFFNQLAEKVDLVVVASKNSVVDGLLESSSRLNCKVIFLDEEKDGFHPDIFNVLEKEMADVYISFGNPLTHIFCRRETQRQLFSLSLKTLWMGCDGYWVDNLRKEKWLRFAPWRFQSWPKLFKEAVAVSGVDGFVCHSNYMADYFKILFDVPENKIFLAHNAVDTTVFERTILKNGNTVKSGRGVIFVGRLAEGKQVERLLKSFRKVERIFSDSYLTIIGEGSKRVELEGFAKKLGLEKCRFLGGIYDEIELAKTIQSHILGVLPGLGGLGINTMMACGLAILSSRADGTGHDLINFGDNGFLFDGTDNDFEKKLLLALQDKDLLLQMGERSFDKIRKEFSIERMVHGYFEAINRVLIRTTQNDL